LVPPKRKIKEGRKEGRKEENSSRRRTKKIKEIRIKYERTFN